MTRPRPISVTIIACLYIIAGTVGFLYHATEFRTQPWLPIAGLEFVRILALVAGAFILRGANWARWLALAWMAFHVMIGFLNGWPQGAMHAAFLVVITFFLLRRPAAEYFAGTS